jgi:hypothetical protein
VEDQGEHRINLLFIGIGYEDTRCMEFGHCPVTVIDALGCVARQLYNYLSVFTLNSKIKSKPEK